MNTLFNAKDYAEIVARIEKLQHNSERLWGKMSSDQMVAHLNEAMKTATGDIVIKRTLIGRLFGGMVKRKLMGESPFGKNNPTAKEFIIADKRNFDKEKTELLALVKRFHENGEKGTATEPHGFFGTMNPQEWGILQWKHLDHHLRQFGA